MRRIPAHGCTGLHLLVRFLLDLIGEELHVLLLLPGEILEQLPDLRLRGDPGVLRVIPVRDLFTVQGHPDHIHRVDRHSVSSRNSVGGASCDPPVSQRGAGGRSARYPSIFARWFRSSSSSSARSAFVFFSSTVSRDWA